MPKALRAKGHVNGPAQSWPWPTGVGLPQLFQPAGPLSKLRPQFQEVTLRLLFLSSVSLAIFSCAPATVGSEIANRDLLVAPLPACYLLHFDGETRPETDQGTLPDTITLTRAFQNDERRASGYAYAGTLPDSILPRSVSMARQLSEEVVGGWSATRDSLILSVPGILRAVAVLLGPKLHGF